MSVELATLTGLKNDLRTFGAATKEITGTAGEALSKGDSFYIGTDGNFYKTASAAESIGTFSLDEQTGLVLERGDVSWRVTQAVNSNGWIAGLLWRHYGTTNVGSNANIIILFVVNPSDGSVTTQTIYTSVYQSFSGSSYNPYSQSVKYAEIAFKDDTHIWIVHDENYVNRDSNNNFVNGNLKIWSKVYTLNETNGAISGLRNESNTLVSNQTSSSNVGSGFGYSVFWPGSDGVFWYKAYTFGQHWNYKVSLNSTYNSSVSSTTYSNNQIASRSSDHYSVGYHYDATNDRTYLFNATNPSLTSYYYATSEQSFTVTNAPDSTDLGISSAYSMVDNLYIGAIGNYQYNTTPITNGNGSSMLVWELDWTSATTLTWTSFPLEVGNFPFPDGVSFGGNSYYQTRNFPWIKIGSDYYFVFFRNTPQEYYYENVNGNDRSYDMYDAVVCKLSKDVANSKYIIDFVCVLDNITPNYGNYSLSIFKDSSNNIKVLGYRYNTHGGSSGSNEMHEVITYDITPYIASGQAGAKVNGVIKADVASGATATGIIEGQLADIAVPVGTSLNGWTGIGNNQAVKG